MLPDDEITVISRKYDQTISRRWKCRLLEERPPLLVFSGEFDTNVEHVHLGSIRRGTVSHEFYWLDRWYNVFRFHEPNGRFRNYYCNIGMPPTFSSGVLEYVDLDIDVIVWPDRRVDILDREDFEANVAKFSYPPNVITGAATAIEDLLNAIERQDFPFDNY
jgi:protein associated with RNAse G/E